MARFARRRAREQLDSVRRNALRLLKLVNTLLEFSRIEAGRLEGSFRPTDLSRGHRRPGQHVPLGDRGRRAAPGGRRAPAARAGLRRPHDVGADRAQPALERAQVHLQRRDRGRHRPQRRRPGRRAARRRHRHRHPRRRAAAPLRALPAGARRQVAHPRGHRHRLGAGARSGRAARRHASRSRASSSAARPSPCAFRWAARTCRPTRSTRTKPARAARASSPSTCKKRATGAATPRRSPRRAAAAGRWCSWPTTTPTCGPTWRACSPTATTSRRWPTGRRRCARSRPSCPTWS